MNLVREPRNGRNFEYAGEDPLLAGVMTGAEMRGIQSNHVISTVKHFALNAQETGRMVANAKIADGAIRTSDLLAFEIAIEQGRPGSVMCSYNRLNEVYACENPELLDVLKTDWKYPGFVMSDWGAVHGVANDANAGLDQESGYTLDDKPYFGATLAQALDAGEVSPARLDDMVVRIVRAMAANGLIDHPTRPGGQIDMAADAKVSQTDAESGLVLLKNTAGLLPLAGGAAKIVVIGGHADKGVIAGGGSSTVFPEGVTAVPDLEPRKWPGPVVFDPSPPLAAILARAGAEHVSWVDGADVAAAVQAAKTADLVIVFGTQWTAESQDAALSLDDGQDALIDAVTAANPKSVVVLETGGPVRMPWLEKAGAVLEAWYPGSNGGEAIARVMFGEVDASGRLPVTFPRDESQLPRPHLDGQGGHNGNNADGAPFTIDYDIEGAAVGYKWFDRQGLEPLFPFGYGLSYTRFEYSGLRVQATGGRLDVSFRIRNVGDRPGDAAPQIYVSRPSGGWEAPKRLAGWSKQGLRPGESRRVYLTVDPRLLATWDEAGHDWKIASGRLDVLLGASSRDIVARASVVTPARRLPAAWRSAQRP
jgi:beta-glucosidase